MTQNAKKDCRCEKTSCGCAGAHIERCTCGDTCDCVGQCQCAGNCGCKRK